jgi:regulator of extracellular matrix RemA (YlzA/DUF370 family)
MFLHIGGSQIVFDNELIGIFDINQVDGAEILASGRLNSRGIAVQSGSRDKPKSLVLTEHSLYLSPIAPLTLAKRFKSRSKNSIV